MQVLAFNAVMSPREVSEFDMDAADEAMEPVLGQITTLLALQDQVSGR